MADIIIKSIYQLQKMSLYDVSVWLTPIIFLLLSLVCLAELFFSHLCLWLADLTISFIAVIGHVMPIWFCVCVCVCASSVWMLADRGFASGFFTVWSYYRSPFLLPSPQSESHTTTEWSQIIPVHCQRILLFIAFCIVLIIIAVKQVCWRCHPPIPHRPLFINIHKW